LAQGEPKGSTRTGLALRAIPTLIVSVVGLACSGSTVKQTQGSDGGTGGQGASGGTHAGHSGGSSGRGSGGVAGVGTGGTQAGQGGAPLAGSSSGGKGGTGGSSGTSGSGNASGTGNASGSGGSSGSGAGDGGTSGSGAGTSGSGNQAGMGGSTGVECQTSDDCQLLTDCCTCAAEPKGKLLASCPAVCAMDACMVKQIRPEDVTCAFGRCVFARSCDLSQVSCQIVTPSCPDGEIPSANGGCYGPCLPPTECSRVTSCADCASSSVCVRYDTEPELQVHCVAPKQDCEAGSYCDCLDACVRPANACSEQDGSVSCACLAC
jgi:hypothetical protein